MQIAASYMSHQGNSNSSGVLCRSNMWEYQDECCAQWRAEQGRGCWEGALSDSRTIHFADNCYMYTLSTALLLQYCNTHNRSSIADRNTYNTPSFHNQATNGGILNLNLELTLTAKWSQHMFNSSVVLNLYSNTFVKIHLCVLEFYSVCSASVLLLLYFESCSFAVNV